MDARFYNSEDIDIDRLANDLVQAYLAQGYKAQQIGGPDQIMVQLKKGGDFEAIIGMQAALTVTIQRTTGGVLAQIGQQRWIDKAAVGAVGLAVLPVLWPLAVTAGVGAIRQASLANQVLNMVDGLVHQQRPGISAGPVPSYLLPQVQQQWGPPSSAETPPPLYVPPAQIAAPQPQATLPARGPRCSHCNTPYESGDTFCSGCGRPLATPKLYCPNCNSELKVGVTFCPKCGANTFPTQSAAQQAIPRPAPAASPPVYTPTPQQPKPQITYVPAQPMQPASATYEPPKPPTPVYTPPPTPPPTPVYQPPKPPMPVYTPPPKPPEPVYVPPAQQQPKDPVSPPALQITYVPSQAAPPPAPPKKEETVYYVPSQAAQQPPTQSHPKVTVVPAKEEPPPPKPKPQKQYYISSNQAQLQPTLPATPAQPAPTPSEPESHQSAAPVDASPAQAASEPADPYASWGSLIFSDGQQIALSSEHAVVGRYDHDLGGIQPEVDLSQKTGADTVSRVHAALEQSGDSYTLTDLNSTNATRLNGKRLEPDKATPINDGDTLQFGKITCTFKKA